MAPRPNNCAGDPRDLLLSGDSEHVPDVDLLSVLVGRECGPALLRSHPAPDALWRVSAEELIELPGVGRAGAARMLACLELSRRASAWKCGARQVVSTPEDVVDLCSAQMRGEDREHFWALALNTKNQLVRAAEVSVGSLNASIVHPRELFKDAIRVSAASLVIVHNHPSGDPTPSGADIQLTRRLVKAGEVLGIELLDHVVIGDGGEFSSLRDLGLM